MQPTSSGLDGGPIPRGMFARSAGAAAVALSDAKSEAFKQHLSDLEEAFPLVDPGVVPLGGRVLVQLRSARKSKRITRHDGTEATLHYADYSQEVERDVQQVARLIAIGPLAFRDKKTLEPWPECVDEAGKFRPWAAPGDYVKVPRYGGDKHFMPIPGRETDKAVFAVINEHEIISKITCNPLSIIAYLE